VADHSDGWIAVQGHIVGNAEKWDHCYHWDRQAFPHKMAAVEHGLDTFGSDDFNVGELRDGRLVWWGWMDNPLLEDLTSVAAALNLEVGRGWSQ